MARRPPSRRFVGDEVAHEWDRLAVQLAPGGVFALWSDDPPDELFLTVLRGAFASCEAHVVTFPNPHTDGEASNTVYVAHPS